MKVYHEITLEAFHYTGPDDLDLVRDFLKSETDAVFQNIDGLHFSYIWWMQGEHQFSQKIVPPDNWIVIHPDTIRIYNPAEFAKCFCPA